MIQKYTRQTSIVCWTEKNYNMFPGLINAELGLLGRAGVCAVWLDVTFSKINNCTGTVIFFFSQQRDGRIRRADGCSRQSHNLQITAELLSCQHSALLCRLSHNAVQPYKKKKKVLLSYTLISLALLLQPISPFAPVLPNNLLGILGGEKSHFVLSDWLVSTNPLQGRLAWDHDGGRHCALAARPRWPSKWTINK